MLGIPCSKQALKIETALIEFARQLDIGVNVNMNAALPTGEPYSPMQPGQTYLVPVKLSFATDRAFFFANHESYYRKMQKVKNGGVPPPHKPHKPASDARVGPQDRQRSENTLSVMYSLREKEL